MSRKNNKTTKPTILFLIISWTLIFLPPWLSGQTDKISPGLREKLERDERALCTAWIYFKDKGPDPAQKMLAIRSALNSENIIRRLRHRSLDDLVDEFDIPVYEKYIEKIKPFASRFRHSSRWLNAVSIEISGGYLEKIAEFPFVLKIEEVIVHRFKEPPPEDIPFPKKSLPLPTAHVFDYGPSYSQLAQINVPSLHDMGLSGKGVLIAMLDAGFNNLNHEVFSHLLIPATWDFVNNDPNVFDEPGQMGSGTHGTQTLAVIAGFYPGKLIGPAYGASFLLAKTENTEWERHIEEDHWIAGAEWAEGLGARIISSSLGYRNQFTHGETDYTWENMDGETAVVTRGANIAASRGVLIVNSAGNEGMAKSPKNTLVAPADSAWVLAVGAVDPDGIRVTFSSMGPTADGRIKPDVMAQGKSVYTATTGKADSYAYVSGTSFSCPLTGGAAALILEANPTWTNSDIIFALKLTAKNASNPDNFIGWGILDALKAAFYPLKKIYPPSHFAVKRLENNFGFFKEYIDRLTWRSNARNQGKIIAYRIYALRLKEKGGQFALLAEVDNRTFQFERRGLLADENFLYKITAVNEYGEESDPDYARQ